MSDLGSPLPLRIAKIQVFQAVEGDGDNILDRIIQTIKQKYGDVAKTNDTIEVSVRGVLCQLRIEKLGNHLILLSIVKHGRGYKLSNVIDNDLGLFDLPDLLSSLAPSSLLSTFTVLIPITEDGDVVKSLLDQYSNRLSRAKLGIGIVRGCLISILESATEEDLFKRYYFLSPLLLPGEAAEKRVEEILSSIKCLAICTAEISRLYSNSRNFFSALESGEVELSEKTEEFLWKLLAPQRVELRILESWLGFIMERDSTISAIAATMRVNYAEAKSIVHRIESIFKRLNERSFEDYPMNFELETRTYNETIKPFGKTVVRSEALKARLVGIMDEVRTYLSLEQQKITMEEQKASKEQLVRLVNLQEILHKLEILIVAFYITEMARLVFEAVAYEAALPLTVAFIPLALLIAVGIRRLLHRPVKSAG